MITTTTKTNGEGMCSSKLREDDLCVWVCVILKLLPTKNAHSTRKVRTIVRNEDIFVGSSQFQRAV